MKAKFVLAVLALLPATGFAGAPTTQALRGDRRVFDVRAIGPAVPALKYEFAVDPLDRRDGNAAILYLQAGLLVNSDMEDVVDNANDNYTMYHKSPANDRRLLDLISSNKPLFELLNAAARCNQCDWNTAGKGLSFESQTPWWKRARTLVNLLRAHCRQQLDSGDPEGAVQTIRLEYALGRNVGKGTPLVAALVGTGITAVASDSAGELCARPDSPNLYWAFLSLPHPVVSLRDAMDGERQWHLAQFPLLAKGRNGGITGDDWPLYVKELAEFSAATHPPNQGPNRVVDQLALGIAAMPGASRYYSETRHLSLEQVSKIDSQLVLATYFLEQYQIAIDEQTKIFSLPLNEALERSEKLPARLKELGIDETNLASGIIPALERVPQVFGRPERTEAALTTIEALRAYAADHGGQLPAKLEDVTDTPVPVNPMTGKMFDYRVENGTATISDTTSPGSGGEKGYPLVYTLRILKP